MSTPTISVIVPVYNVESYLSDCIDSILAQTYTDFELILVNDGSTDDSASIAKKYTVEHPEKVILITQENSGPGPARNTGISHAKGEYILFIDSDDIVEPAMLEKLHQSATTLQSQIVISPYYRHGLFDELTIEGIFDFHINKTYSGKDFLMQTDSKITTCAKLYRTEWMKTLPFPDIWFEDVAWLAVLMSKAETISYVSEPFYHYLRHDTSIVSSTKNDKILESVDAVHFIMKNMDEKNKAAATTYVAKLLLYMSIRRPAFADHYIKLIMEYKDTILSYCDFSNKKLKKQYDYFYTDFSAIPKIIYYDHFGKKPFTEKEEKNIHDWIGTIVEFDAEIVCLNEDNCNIDEEPFIKTAYEKGNYAFVGHYFKCKRIKENGGIALTANVQGKKYITPLLLRTRSIFGFYDPQNMNSDFYVGAAGEPVYEELLSMFSEATQKETPSFDELLNELIFEKYGVNYSSEIETNFKHKYLSLKNDTIRIYATSVFTNDYGIPPAFTVLSPSEPETLERDGHAYRLVDDFYYQMLSSLPKEYQTYQQDIHRKTQAEELTKLNKRLCKSRERIDKQTERIETLKKRLNKKIEQLEKENAKLQKKADQLKDVQSHKFVWFLYRVCRKLFGKKTQN